MKRWKEHCAASLLKNHNERTNKFYCAYPSSETNASENEILRGKRGNFEQLQQLVGVGFSKELMSDITSWFSWSAYEVEQLGLLAGVGNMYFIQQK